VTPLVLSLCLNAPDAGALLARPVELRADRLEVDSRAQKATYLGHATAVRDGATLTCDRLEVQFDERRDVKTISARGHVVVVDGDRRAEGEHATWDNATGVLVVTGQPWVRQGPREVSGERVTFTSGVDRVEIERPRTRVQATDGGVSDGLAIDADSLVLENPRATATWKGHVKVTLGATVLTAPELVAHYDERGDITRVQANGGVEATERDRWARGQRADYDVKRGVLVVTGKAEARQGRSRLEGTRVTFFPGTDFIEVENATTVIEVDRRKGGSP
jgi:lipopolysaccharide export system protein LptA